jgi:hypothetical protein
MISERRQGANRANARLSTGPKTAEGKRRASRNARRHGLNVPVLQDPSLAEEVEVMAACIAGKGASDELLGLARDVAEAQIDLDRIRLYRRRQMQEALSAPPRHSQRSPSFEPSPAKIVADLVRTIQPSTAMSDALAPDASSQFVHLTFTSARSWNAIPAAIRG